MIRGGEYLLTNINWDTTQRLPPFWVSNPFLKLQLCSILDNLLRSKGFFELCFLLEQDEIFWKHGLFKDRKFELMKVMWIAGRQDSLYHVITPYTLEILRILVIFSNLNFVRFGKNWQDQMFIKYISFELCKGREGRGGKSHLKKIVVYQLWNDCIAIQDINYAPRHNSE